MLSFMEYCLQVYFEKTNWQREHFYSNLTQASRGCLFLNNISNNIKLT
jgi:hypothetical protein